MNEVAGGRWLVVGSCPRRGDVRRSNSMTWPYTGPRTWGELSREILVPSHAGRSVRMYRDLSVWQRAMDLIVVAYRLSKRFPKDELYGLTSQIRRAATSVPANIAEGQGRRYTGEFLQFLSVARGSLLELETHVFAAQRLGYLDTSDIEPCLDLAAEVGRMLSGLIRSLEARMPRGRSHRPLATGHQPQTISG